MADEGTGRPLGGSPSTEFYVLSGVSASTPGLIITGTSPGTANTLHTAGAFRNDQLFVQAFNNSAGSATVYAQVGSTASTQAIPLTLAAGANAFLLNGVCIGFNGVVSVWNGTATTGVVLFGQVQGIFASG